MGVFQQNQMFKYGPKVPIRRNPLKHPAGKLIRDSFPECIHLRPKLLLRKDGAVVALVLGPAPLYFQLMSHWSREGLGVPDGSKQFFRQFKPFEIREMLEVGNVHHTHGTTLLPDDLKGKMEGRVRFLNRRNPENHIPASHPSLPSSVLTFCTFY
jgi:hypothetical protein